MSHTEKPPLPSEKDPIYAAIGLHWPREVLMLMGRKDEVGRKLLAAGHVSEAGRWHELWGCIESCAFRGNPPPPELEVVHAILRTHCPDTA